MIRSLSMVTGLLVLAVAGCQATSAPAATGTSPTVAAGSPASTIPSRSSTALPSASPATAETTATTPDVATPIPAQAPLIAYQWTAGEGNGLYLMRPDGSRSTALPVLPGTSTTHPDWSPDGSRLAFEAAGPKALDLWTSAADGSDARRLVERNNSCTSTTCGDAAQPAWSPDGTRIAYVRSDFTGDTYLGAALVVEDLASGARADVHHVPGGQVLAYPRWSPDGTRLVFETETIALDASSAPTSSWISVVPVGPKPAAARTITKPAMWAAYPDWRRSGPELIVFTTYDLNDFQQTDEPSNLYVIRPDGTGLRQLTHYGHADQRATQPTWTPDGTRILFTLVAQASGDFDYPRQAAFVDADGGNLVVLPGLATHPRLRPLP